MQSPSDRVNALRLFDDRSNNYRFNQLVLVGERTLADGNEFDFGGRVELLYGSDARFTHAAGLLAGRSDDTVQFDPVEFYAKVRVPLGNGVTVRAGKCTTPIGAEVLEAPVNALYSHGFLYDFATPISHTGIDVSYPLSDRTTVHYFLLRGWDVWIDNNDATSQMAGVSWTSDDQAWALTGNVITGPERRANDTDYRTLLDLIATHQWSEPFSSTVNADYAYEEGAAAGGTDAGWWGISTYETYRFDPAIAATLRAEYFVDQDGSRTGFTADLLEVTAGLDLVPFSSFKNLRLRPEVRWDHAFGDRPFDGGTRADQGTLAVDVILTF
ncbi:MAG: porin [Planctomycetes bacterium]|nr:porin [Planctomycetota bacterium]